MARARVGIVRVCWICATVATVGIDSEVHVTQTFSTSNQHVGVCDFVLHHRKCLHTPSSNKR